MYKLSEKDISTIETHLNAGGKKEIVVKIESGKIVIFKAERKKIA